MRYFQYVILLLALLSGATGCATFSKSTGSEAALPDQQSPSSEQAAPASPDADKSAATSAGVVELLSLPQYGKPVVTKGVYEKEFDVRQLRLDETPVAINVDGMPIADFITHAFGEVLKVPYYLDEQLKALKTPVTLRMTEEALPATALEVAVSVLEENGIDVTQRAGTLYIRKTRPVQIAYKAGFGRDLAGNEGQVMQFVAIRHIEVGVASSLIKELLNPKAKIQRTGNNDNLLLLIGDAAEVKAVIDFLTMVDVPYMAEGKAFLLHLTYWNAKEFGVELTRVMQALGYRFTSQLGRGGIMLMPLDYLKSIMVVSPDENTTAAILEWKGRLDTAEAMGTERRAFTYKPKYARASDLATALTSLLGLSSSAPGAASPAPSMSASQAYSAGGQQQQAAAQVRGAAAGPTRTAASDVMVSAEPTRNLLLVFGTATDYRNILAYMTDLDVPPRQVLIEATIAEVTLKDDLRFGMEWFMRNSMEGGNYSMGTYGKLGVDQANGFLYQFVSDSYKFQYAFNAFAQKNLINIISTPRLVVLDNQEASMHVGTEIPVVSSEASSGDVGGNDGSSIMRNIQYRSTGISLNVKPTINSEGLLTLTISQEVSEAQSNSLSGIDSPIILSRNISTNIVAMDGQTVVLGGIISENKSDTKGKVPLLSDLPILGHLFKTYSEGSTRTELIVMLKPTIITDLDDMRRITRSLAEEFENLKISEGAYK